MPPFAPARGFRAATLLAIATLFAAPVRPATVQAQSAAPAAAIVSTPAGALPSVSAGALGSGRLSVGIRYSRLTDRYVIAADEISVEGSETFERDVYAAELSIGLFGGSARLQGGRSHARYIYQRADTADIASPHGLLASLGYARQMLSLGAGMVRLGVGSDLTGGWADLSGETALSAHGQLPISLRVASAGSGFSAWAAPGVAWGALRNEFGTVATAAAGLRLELPTGTSLDVAATQLLGDQEAVWGGNDARLSVGISHSFGAGNSRDRAPSGDPAGYRPRYSAAAQPKEKGDSTSGASGQAEQGDRGRRPRPRTMPRDGESAKVANGQDASRAGEAAPQQAAGHPPGQRHPAAIPDRPARQAEPAATKATERTPARRAAATPATPATPARANANEAHPQPATPAAPANANAGERRAEPASPAVPATPVRASAGEGRAQPAAPAAPATPAPRPTSEERRTIFYAEEKPEPSAAPAPVAPANETVPSPAPVSRATPANAPANTPASTRAAPPSTRSTAPRPGARFTIQAAAVKTNAEAVQLRDSLTTAGFPARIFDSPDYFRVRVGRFTTRSAADAFAQRMREVGFEAWVTTVETES